MEEIIELIKSDYNTRIKIKILMNFVNDMDTHSRDYSLKRDSIDLFNIMTGRKLDNYDLLLKLKQGETPILNLVHNLFREKYQNLFEGDYRDNINNPLSTHKQFLCDLLKILKNLLENTEEYKLKMEQKRLNEEEERLRLAMEKEKEIQKLKDYALKIRLRKTEQIPCPNCGQLKSRGNMATHMTMNVCKNFGKEIEVRKKGYFTCQYCGKEERNTNRQNHYATKKCMEKRDIVC
jgi:DNA-directed RNA polymerase subunit RPC12/RpoP